MTDKREHEDLIEPQGVNAGAPVDEDPGDTDVEQAPPPPETPPTPNDTLDGEHVALPGEKPGYPGQQNSVDTS
ncbi:hypothetical protein [Actinomadura flavalba]|uniref:hypothetical protein n=1 Tax=Actinomadura flavalba TaxID=1120938 RepID=UPI0003A253AB|nr:hypothetical protein [Actinomadura flavalba]